MLKDRMADETSKDKDVLDIKLENPLFDLELEPFDPREYDPLEMERRLRHASGLYTDYERSAVKYGHMEPIPELR